MNKIWIVFIALAFTASGQSFFPAPSYKKGFFDSPVRIPLSLAGNFGECRPNHFHSGLDIRTNKVENIPIYAIADGFVSRIKIEPGGFGNAIYITHNNGTISLYAHLNKFWPELESYVRAKQYETKSWKQDLTLIPTLFSVKKGQFIAYSGNTGSSQAPHLHMEIRDVKTDKPLNGLLFYNLKDTKAPLIKKLALYDLHKSIYDQKPVMIPLTMQGNKAILSKDTIITNSSLIGLGIVADDPMENALGVLGVFEVNLYIDNHPHFGWQLDNIGYEETRYMNALADYKTKKENGPWIQLCYKLPGDQLNIYKSFNKLNGRLDLSDGKAHLIKLIVKDVNNNFSVLETYIKSNLSVTERKKYTFLTSKSQPMTNEYIQLELKKGYLYDDVNNLLSISSSQNPYSHLYQVLYHTIPIHDLTTLKLKPKQAIPPALSGKVAIVHLKETPDGSPKGKAAKMENGWAVAEVKELGKYEIVIDQTPPAVSSTLGPKLTSKFITVTASDETTSIQSFTGKIDGKWVRFVQKGKNYTYEVDEYCPLGNHVLEIEAVDENGNVSRIKKEFTR